MRKIVFLILVSSIVLLYFIFRHDPAVPESLVSSRDTIAAEYKTERHITEAPSVQHLHVTERQQEELASHFAQAAAWYKEELAYPAYSRPLTQDDVQLLNPNHYVVQTVPLQGNASAAIVLQQYRYIYPESVKVLLQFSGLDIYSAELQLTHAASGERLVREGMQASDEGFILELAPAASWQGELNIEISFRAAGQQQQLITAFDYQQPSAFITGVASAYAEQADLVIPINIDVEQAGTYRLRANLFDAEGRPLAYLTRSEYLATGSQQLALKAIKSVLGGQTGPYQLGQFILERRSGHPAELPRFGRSEQASYTIEFSDYDRLLDAQHQPDEAELQRLQFLQQMAGKEGG